MDSCTANPMSAHKQSSWLVKLILTNPPSNSEMPCKHRQKHINSTIRSQQSYPSAMILKTTGGTRIVGWCSVKDNVMTVMSMLADSKSAWPMAKWQIEPKEFHGCCHSFLLAFVISFDIAQSLLNPPIFNFGTWGVLKIFIPGGAPLWSGGGGGHFLIRG